MNGYAFYHKVNALSWRVMILPYLEQNNLYQQFNFSGDRYRGWGSSAADPLVIAQTAIPGFYCPSDPTINPISFTSAEFSGWPNGTNTHGTNYGAVHSASGVDYEQGIGSGGFVGATLTSANWFKARSFGGLPFHNISIRDFTDGTSNTVQVAEMFRGRAQQGSSCMPSGNAEALRYTGNIFNYGCTANAPGATHPLGKKAGVWTYESGMGGAVTGNRAPNDKRTDRACCGDFNSSTSRDALAASSAHAGGVMALYADGSVHFVGDNVNLQTWANTTTYGFGESSTISD